MLEIGEKIKRRRVSLGLTQEELAARVELSKGFISQVERDLTSPSIATLTDILEALGMSLADFFSQEDTNEKVVFGADDVFVKEDEDAGHSIHWLIPNAQKNSLEPILVTLQSGANMGAGPARGRGVRLCSAWRHNAAHRRGNVQGKEGVKLLLQAHRRTLYFKRYQARG